jgi:4-amino-4-deoxy-L-arabinose transferase-like glycosyltransferase
VNKNIITKAIQKTYRFLIACKSCILYNQGNVVSKRVGKDGFRMIALLTNKRQCTFFAIIIFAALVRLIGIASRPIWYDEAFAILFSAKGLAAMLFGTLAPTGAGAADIHPLGYYALLWSWMQVFGQSLIAVRLLSIFAGVVTVAISYLLALELFNKRIANLAALFVALAPFQVHYSQEIRMYSFMAMWLLLATYAFQRGANSRSLHWWVLFSLFAALAQYTHNLSAFFLLSLAATPLLRKNWKNLSKVVLAGLGALILYLPWLLQIPSQLTKVSSAYWVERPTVAKIFTLLLVYVTNLPLPNNLLLFVSLFIALTVIAIAIMQTFRRDNRNTNAFGLLYLAFVPPTLLFTVSQWLPIYIERALLPSGVIFCIWLAWALFDTRLPTPLRNGLLILLGAGAVFGLYQHITYNGFPYAPYKELNTALSKRLATGDIILHSNKLSFLPSTYFNPDLPQAFIADPPGSSVDTLASATQQVLGLEAETDIESAAKGAENIWFIIFEQSNQEFVQMGASMHPHLSWLTENYSLLEIEIWRELRLYNFSKTP